MDTLYSKQMSITFQKNLFFLFVVVSFFISYFVLFKGLTINLTTPT